MCRRRCRRTSRPADRPARALFVDNLLDVAVIELAEGAVPAEASEARLACGRVPPVGSDLGAFGHPLGYAFTATRGIMAGVTVSEGYPMIQTDTPISPGNSGGPLIDLAPAARWSASTPPQWATSARKT
jgi:S1-C subfamily serine protease